jgi:hypothetical protein
MVRALGEVSLKQDGDISLGIGGSIESLPEQSFHGSWIPDPSFRREHTHREYSTVPLQNLPSPIRGGIVEDDHLIVTPELLHDLADLPDQDADRRSFVM